MLDACDDRHVVENLEVSRPKPLRIRLRPPYGATGCLLESLLERDDYSMSLLVLFFQTFAGLRLPEGGASARFCLRACRARSKALIGGSQAYQITARTSDAVSSRGNRNAKAVMTATIARWRRLSL